jgi:hypothetical protein
LFAPLLSFPEGVYNEDIALELAYPDDEIQPLIYFTFDGTEPDSLSFLYHNKIIISRNTIIKAVAYHENYIKSEIVSANYTILNPPRNLNGYSRNDECILEWEEPLNCITNGIVGYGIYKKLSVNTIFRLLDIIPSNQHIYVDSLITAGIYDYRVVAYYEEGESLKSDNLSLQVNQVLAPRFNLDSGYYQKEISIFIFSLTDAAEIYYTTDGSEPNLKSTLFTAPIKMSLDSTLVVKAIAYRMNYIPSPIVTNVFTTTGTLLPPAFANVSNIFENRASVAFLSPDREGEIRYTLDGSEVTENSPLYEGIFPIVKSTTVKAKTFKSHWEESAESRHEFLIVNIPVDLKTEVVRDSVYISWSEPLMVTNEEYNKNGRKLLGYNVYMQSENSDDNYISLTEEPISETNFSIGGLATDEYSLFVEAVYNNDAFSRTEISNFTINKVGNVALFPPSGNYYDNLEVSLRHDFATIYYTLNGSEPDENSAVYRSPIRIPKHSAVTLKYRAYFDNYIPSDVFISNYKTTDTVINPQFNIPGGTYFNTFLLELSCNSENSIIRYTLDGSEPDSTSMIYYSPIAIAGKITVKAIATVPNWKSSDVVTQNYDIYTSVEEEIPTFASTTRLLSAYPNPFSSKTNIPYSLETPLNVEIEIFNLLGQKITTLTSGRKGSGQHNVSWDGLDDNGREVAGGVYFCRMKALDQTQMIKIMYIK